MIYPIFCLWSLNFCPPVILLSSWLQPYFHNHTWEIVIFNIFNDSNSNSNIPFHHFLSISVLLFPHIQKILNPFATENLYHHPFSPQPPTRFLFLSLLKSIAKHYKLSACTLNSLAPPFLHLNCTEKTVSQFKSKSLASSTSAPL